MLREFTDRPNAYESAPPRRVEYKGAIEPYTWDWAPYEALRGVTVDAVTWETSNSGAVTISGDALASSVSTAYLTAVDEGRSLITLTATSSGTPVAVRHFIVRVVDPSVSISGSTW